MCMLCGYCEIHFTRVFIVHFRLSKILLDLQDDSDVAESEVGSEEDDGEEQRLELILDPLSCQETSENE